MSGWIVYLFDKHGQRLVQHIPFGKISEEGAIRSWFKVNFPEYEVKGLNSLNSLANIEVGEKFKCMIVI
jgi:hypothetical protein